MGSHRRLCRSAHAARLRLQLSRRHGDSVQVTGFSGTTDNSSVLPLGVKVQHTDDESKRGTDALMVSLLLQPGKCSFAQLESAADANLPVALQVLDWTVTAGANALIDAGAAAGWCRRCLPAYRTGSVACRALCRMSALLQDHVELTHAACTAAGSMAWPLQARDYDLTGMFFERFWSWRQAEPCAGISHSY